MGAAKHRILTRYWRTFLIYGLFVLALSTGIAAASWLFSPITAGVVVFCLLLAIGVPLVGRLSAAHTPAPVRTLKTELAQTRRGYQRLFSAVPCYICVLNRGHQIIEANSLYRKEFGATDLSICYQVCKKRAAPCTDCIVDRTFKDGEIHSGEETLVTNDGRRINVVVHTRPVLDGKGSIVSVMEVFTDITEVKMLQRQLALTGKAVAGMAHRVKNILMGLEGGIFIVNDGLEQDNREAIAEGWEMVERNVQRVSSVVKDLLFCSKDRTPKFEKDVRIHEIVEDVRDLYADRMAGENINIRAELNGSSPVGSFDPEGIHSVLCNLVANAIDACRFDPDEEKNEHTITLRCRENGKGEVHIEVEDDGAGIPDDLSDKVFQEFFSSKGTEGTGIGLLVVQKVVEEHGGKVTFNTSPGQGTRFIVTLPAASDLSDQSPPDADSEPSTTV